MAEAQTPEEVQPEQEVNFPSQEEIAKAMSEMTPERQKEMQENMQKMQQEQIENAQKQQKEQIEALSKVLVDFTPMFLEYVPKAVRSEATLQPFVNETINNRIAHSIIGINTELSELNKAVYLEDKVNIIEELGDILWYLAVAQDELKFLDTLDLDANTIKSIMAGKDTSYSIDVMDLLKRSMFYGSDFKTENCVKPYQSIYIGVVVNSLKLGTDLSEIIDVNLKKLFKRYPEQFEKELAELRDLDAERKTMEDAVAK